MSAQTKLPLALANVIHRAVAWWTPPPIPRRTARTLTWGDQDLGAYADAIHVSGPDLTVDLVGRSGSRLLRGRETQFDELTGKVLTGEADDGWRFRAERAFVASWSSNLSRETQTTDTVRVRGWDWTFMTPTKSSGIWVSELEGELPIYLGNLSLDAGSIATRTSSSSRGHYYLHAPFCDYAIVSHGREKKGR